MQVEESSRMTKKGSDMIQLPQRVFKRAREDVWGEGERRGDPRVAMALMQRRNGSPRPRSLPDDPEGQDAAAPLEIVSR